MSFNDRIGGFSVFNLALNAVGQLTNNSKNVALYILNEDFDPKNIIDKAFKQEILQPNILLNTLEQRVGIWQMTTVCMSAEINENSKLMEHPVEDGSVVADFKVKMPTEITIRITLPYMMYEDILAELRKYKDDGQMIYIETKFGNYKNMQIVSIPAQLTADNISRITFSVKFKEVLMPQRKTSFISANEKDTDTVSTGNAPTVIVE